MNTDGYGILINDGYLDTIDSNNIFECKQAVRHF